VSKKAKKQRKTSKRKL